MTTGVLFADAADTQRTSNPAEDRIALAAFRLAVAFTEDEHLPARYRKSAAGAQKNRKVTKGSKVEERFMANAQAWRRLIATMLTKLEPEQAWRFINLVPEIDGTLTQVTDNQGFRDFMDYLILRRDQEHCDADELGGLAQLSVALQRQVERHITTA